MTSSNLSESDSFHNETLQELRNNPIFFGTCLMFYFAIQVFGNGMLYAIRYYKNYAKDPMKCNLVDRLIAIVCSVLIANNLINVNLMTYFLLIGPLDLAGGTVLMYGCAGVAAFSCVMLAEMIVIHCLYIHGWQFMATIDDHKVGDWIGGVTVMYFSLLSLARVAIGEPEANVICCFYMARMARDMTEIERTLFNFGAPYPVLASMLVALVGLPVIARAKYKYRKGNRVIPLVLIHPPKKENPSDPDPDPIPISSRHLGIRSSEVQLSIERPPSKQENVDEQMNPDQGQDLVDKRLKSNFIKGLVESIWCVLILVFLAAPTVFLAANSIHSAPLLKLIFPPLCAFVFPSLIVPTLFFLRQPKAFRTLLELIDQHY